MKRIVPLWITAIGGVIMILTYFVPLIKDWGAEVGIWFTILAAIAYVLGGGNLVKIQLRKISDQRPGWGYAAVMLGAFLATLGVGLLKVGVPASDKYPHLPWSGNYVDENGAFGWIYGFAYEPLQGTMFSLLAFFVASAAFRAFRAKNVEATLLLATAFIVLLGRTTAGYVLTAWVPDSLSGLRIPEMTTTILQVFNAAGQRAIMIGIALGIVAGTLESFWE